MKTKFLYLLFIVILFSIQSCDKENINPGIEDFCRAKPEGWVCEIIQSDLKEYNFQENTLTPIAIIKYKSLNREITTSNNQKENPSLIINLYSIAQKDELIDFIQSQAMYSWCIPIYYGESKEYFVVTSPCFINGGSFTEEAKASIEDLHQALAGILTNTNKNLTGH